MNGFQIFGYAIAAMLVAQGLFLLVSPQRAAAFQLRKYRRIFGARPAEPGFGTFLLYRLMGAAALAMGLYVAIRVSIDL